MEPEKPHRLPDECRLLDKFSNNFATVYLYKHFVVLEVNEGVIFSFHTGIMLLVKILKIYGVKPWFIISNRARSYSIDPNDYHHLERVPTLKGIAIVTNLAQARASAKLEVQFFKKPFEIFEDMETAYRWGLTLLSKS